MGLIFLDSFDDRYFATGTSYATYHAKWEEVDEDSAGGYLLEQVSSGNTGKACKLGGNSYLKKTGLNTSDLLFGFALKVPTAPATETTIVEIQIIHSETQSVFIQYKLTPTMYIKIYIDSTYTVTSLSAISTDTFYYIEAYNNVGIYTSNLFKDGVSWLMTNPIWPATYPEAYINSIKFFGGIIIDDLYLSTGTSSRLYPIKIDAVVPTSNGTADTNAWSSVDYQDVDECFQANNDGNSSYDESNTASPSRVSYNFPDISVNSLKGVQTLNWVAGYWNGAGSATNVNMTAITRVSSTYYESNTKSCSSSTTPTYVLLVGLWENNPNTSTAWTSSTYNGAEFGVKAAPSSNNLGRLTAITIEAAYDYTTTPPASSRIFIIS